MPSSRARWRASSASAPAAWRVYDDVVAHGGDQAWHVFIRALLASVADTVLIPMQDVLGLGTEARMNLPATLGGNGFNHSAGEEGIQSIVVDLVRFRDNGLRLRFFL